jgi:ribonuclease-3
MLRDIIIRIKLLFIKDKELYFDLKKIIGFYPGNIELYKQALLHKSIMHRNSKGKPVNNERLEFLGDAVLDAVVGDIVFHHFPGKREGFLTNTRSKLVQRNTLGKLAKEMGITRLILTSGRSQSHNSYLGGNAFEALVGAMYLDRGYDECMKFIKKKILQQQINIDKVAYKEVNFKSKLLEWAQKNNIVLEFKLIKEEKDKDGSPTFSYTVMLEKVEGCQGKGFSKKESQQMASKLTLDKLRNESKFLDNVFASKSERTKMEEEPVTNVPITEEMSPKNNTDTVNNKKNYRNPRKKRKPSNTEENITTENTNTSEKKKNFDLSDISLKEKSKEEIIAMAESAAFETKE